MNIRIRSCPTAGPKNLKRIELLRKFTLRSPSPSCSKPTALFFSDISQLPFRFITHIHSNACIAVYDIQDTHLAYTCTPQLPLSIISTARLGLSADIDSASGWSFYLNTHVLDYAACILFVPKSRT